MNIIKDSKLKLNSIYNTDSVIGMADIPDGSIDLIIADPPYFKVINQGWDYKWKTREEYVAWNIEWLKQAYRVLRYGGSIYLFGYFRTLVYIIPHLESLGFELRQQITIDKGLRSISGRRTSEYKMFPTTTESIVFLFKNPKPFVRSFLKERQIAMGMTGKEINDALGVKSNGGGMWSIYTGKNVCEQIPTRDHWNKLQEILQFKYPYEKLSITFNPQIGITDVWTDIDFYEEGQMGKRIHPTQKPESLITRLVLASSNVGDIILDPFMGSGTTAVCSYREGRSFIGYELDEDSYRKSLDRLDKEMVGAELWSVGNSSIQENVHQFDC